MSDDFDDALKQWMHQRAGDDRAAIQTLVSNVALLPPRRGRQNRLVPLAASVAVLLGALWLLSPRFGGITDEAASTPTSALATSPSPAQKPTGPEAFAGDPRLARCFGTAEDMEFVFVMSRARDYQLFLPNMGTSPELDVDDSALVVVYREGWAGPQITGVPGAKPESPTPGRRFVCVVAGTSDPVLYGDVDIEGLSLAVEPSFTPPSPTPRPPTPGDPYAWLDDPRLHQCYFTGRPNQMEYVFEVTGDRDYGLFLSNPGLVNDVDAHGTALVVVYRADVPYPPNYGPDPGPQLPQTPPPGIRVACMVFDGVLSQNSLDITSLDIAALPTGPTDLPSSEPPPSANGPTPTPAPAWMGDLLGQLECDGPPQTVGGEVGELAPVGGTGTASPYPWLYAEDIADLPLEGWIEDPKVPWESGSADNMRYVNVVRGNVKALIIMSGHSVDGGVGHWQIVGFRACDPGEFDPLRGRTTDDLQWLDANGLPVPGVSMHVGPAHCGWESTVWLHLDDDERLYIRDPAAVLRDIEVGDYLSSTTLPADVKATGWRSRDRELFVTASDDFVFIRTPDGVERWPRSTDALLGCA